MNSQTFGYKAKAFELRNLVFYFLLAFGLAWLDDALIIFGVLKQPSSISEQFGTVPGILIIVLGFGPTIAAFVMTAIAEGKTGVKALWRRFWNRNMSFKWLLVTLLFLPVVRLVINLVARTLDGQAYPLLEFADQPWMVIPVIPQFLVAFIFNGMTEEFGWRGYALPRFQARRERFGGSPVSCYGEYGYYLVLRFFSLVPVRGLSVCGIPHRDHLRFEKPGERTT